MFSSNKLISQTQTRQPGRKTCGNRHLEHDNIKMTRIGRIYAGLIWLRIETGDFCKHGSNEASGPIKGKEFQ